MSKPPAHSLASSHFAVQSHFPLIEDNVGRSLLAELALTFDAFVVDLHHLTPTCRSFQSSRPSNQLGRMRSHQRQPMLPSRMRQRLQLVCSWRCSPHIPSVQDSRRHGRAHQPSAPPPGNAHHHTPPCRVDRTPSRSRAHRNVRPSMRAANASRCTSRGPTHAACESAGAVGLWGGEKFRCRRLKVTFPPTTPPTARLS